MYSENSTLKRSLGHTYNFDVAKSVVLVGGLHQVRMAYQLAYLVTRLLPNKCVDHRFMQSSSESNREDNHDCASLKFKPLRAEQYQRQRHAPARVIILVLVLQSSMC